MSETESCGRSKYEVDMTRGPILGHLVRFSITVTLTGLLQILYNMVDTIVVGRFAGKEALAAVGSTGSLINLLITLFIGLSVGASITLAKHYGEGNYKAVSETAHTAITLSVICGVFIGIVGYCLTEPILLWMGVPEDIIDQATLYMQLYFVGVPFQFVNVFGSAILRAVGDTRRPLYILILAGLLNVVLNLVFVIQFHMGVAGVAWGTVFSSALSGYLVLRVLMRTEGPIRITLQNLTIKKRVMQSIARIGLPAGLEGATFGISNVLIQSAVNSFGSVVVAGSAIAVSLNGLVYVLMQSINQACMTFTSQNMGARLYRRVRRSPLITIGLITVIVSAVAAVMLYYAAPLSALFNSEPEVVKNSVLRMSYTFPFYFLFGIMQTFTSQIRGMGHSFMPMLVSITGISGIRILWLYTAFAITPTQEVLFVGYPVSWISTMLIIMVCYIALLRKLPKDDLAVCVAPE